ncbi:uncharacterized protein LOC127861053 [Dreissena polymorpha]|uniref:Uncharacterized protein n=1 Tax=Dreissena polymorpha TaxID=45954 RepID=A0A9D3YP56_DREPO|nr:uncharacterized protein LOC127861053 [Dreissena polymorpha]KAH3702578.1 hypothetical protein DPMN_077602 [Dreissena polymorpha]
MNNGTFGTSDTHEHWTGVIRTHAMLYAKNKDFITSSSIKYAVINHDISISYEVDGCRSSLCESDDTSTYTTSTTSGFAKNACTHGGSTQNGSSANAVGVGIGLAVGLLCTVGAVVVIIVLRRRGVLPCRLGSKNDKINSESRDCVCKSNVTYENEIQNHNYFILEKCAKSVVESGNKKNTPDEPNESNAETDNYTSINETDEPYQTIKDEYDYTTNALRTGHNSTNPDNVYNKLKLDLPGDYARVGRLGHNISTADSDYDATAVARRNDGDGDYNHIPHPDSTTCARRNGSKDDYDVINGKKIKFPPSDSADYAHVKI